MHVSSDMGKMLDDVSAAALVGYRRLLVAHACSPHDRWYSRRGMGGDQPQVIYTQTLV